MRRRSRVNSPPLADIVIEPVQDAFDADNFFPLKCVEDLLEFDVYGMEEHLAGLFGMEDYRYDIEKALILDLFTAVLHFGKERDLEPEILSAILTTTDLLLTNVKDHLSVADSLIHFRKLLVYNSTYHHPNPSDVGAMLSTSKSKARLKRQRRQANKSKAPKTPKRASMSSDSVATQRQVSSTFRASNEVVSALTDDSTQPSPVKLFPLTLAKDVCDYFHTAFFQHYKLHEYVFSFEGNRFAVKKVLYVNTPTCYGDIPNLSEAIPPSAEEEEEEVVAKSLPPPKSESETSEESSKDEGSTVEELVEMMLRACGDLDEDKIKKLVKEVCEEVVLEVKEDVGSFVERRERAMINHITLMFAADRPTPTYPQTPRNTDASKGSHLSSESPMTQTPVLNSSESPASQTLVVNSSESEAQTQASS